MAKDFKAATATFARDQRFKGNDPLCVAPVATLQARKTLRLDATARVTVIGDQLPGLGKGFLQAVANRFLLTNRA
jgi:hypothetical protein